MSSNAPTSDRVWPESGLWGAAARPLFPLASLWAVVAVALWQWAPDFVANLPDPLMWHVHEMVFGFGGAAVAGYLLSAVSSWTGIAPVHGAPVKVVVTLWLTTRVLMLTTLPAWLAILPSVAFFWLVAALLIRQARRAGKGLRLDFVIAMIIAGLGSGLWILAIQTQNGMGLWSALPVLGFAALLIHMGGRMVPAFLTRAAEYQGNTPRPVRGWMREVTLACLALTAMFFLGGQDGSAAAAMRIAGLFFLAFLATWPMRPALGDTLLAMLTIPCLWVPAGLVLWGTALTTGVIGPTEALHALVMGAMAGHIMGLSARAFALRTPDGLRARRGMGMAYALILLSVPARMAVMLDLSAALWCAGWLLYALRILPHLSGPVPRPIFSGARG